MFNILLAVVGAATLTALYLCVAYGVIAVASVVGPQLGVAAEVEAMTRVALVGAAALFPVTAGLCLYWFSPGTVRGETASVLRARYSGEAATLPAESNPRDDPSSPDDAPPAGAEKQTELSPADTASDAEAGDRPTATREEASDGSDDDRQEVATDGTELVENASR